MQIHRDTTAGPAALPDEALLIKIDRFAFTANNITYAVLGDQLKYCSCFRRRKFRQHSGVGIWRGDRLEHPGVAIGERLFGYFPMATHLVIEAADVSKRGLRDAAAHRQGVAPVLQRLCARQRRSRLRRAPGDYQALLRPLFMLSFLVDDFLAENSFTARGA